MIWTNLINLIPGLFAALLILIVGYFLAVILESVVRKALMKLGLDRLMEHYRLSDAISNYNLSTLCGKIVFWYIVVIFLHSAVANINITGLSKILNDFAGWLPDFVAGFIIFIAGLLAGQIVYNKVLENVKTDKDKVKPIARGLKGLTVFFVTLIAIGQLGIRIMLVEQTWLVVVSSVALAFAIGVGLSLGHALKEPMKKGIKKLHKL